MSAQILLQGRLRGTEEFLLSPPADRDNNRVFEARLVWLALLGEVLPRALLAELGLPTLMLGSSGGGRFLVILPDQPRADAAGEFLKRAAAVLDSATNGMVHISWSATENLGDWTVIRKRLAEGAVAADPKFAQPDFFEPFAPKALPADRIPRGLRDATSISFSFDFPALISTEEAAHRWTLGNAATPDNISTTRHAARNGDVIASPRELAKRARGQKLWGVLRGEIDDYGTRLRRVQSVEEHVQLSMLYKQFLAGEIELLCSQGEYFQRVTVLSAGAADFAVCGSWDALSGFARELQRVFAVFASETLKELPGAEAKTITMAMTLADPGDTLARTWEESAVDLETAQAADKDCLYILGRVLEWKQLSDASELRDAIVQLNEEFRGGKHFLAQLRNLYRKVEAGAIDNERLLARTIRFQRRFARVANRKEREFQKLRAHLIKEVSARGAKGKIKLRPEGLVALEWARLAQD
jgi:CRISPR-associated protein Csm1